MKSIIQFHVTKEDKYFVAQCLELPIVTQALTLDELAKNIEEALSLHLEDEDTAALGLSEQPSVLVSYELPRGVHVEA